jgi:hypothetical protein
MEFPVPKALRNLNFKSLRSQPRKKLPKAILTGEIATGLLPKKKLKQDLTVDKFTDITADAALVLSAHQGSLSLNGLASLSDESAEALSRHANFLYLNGLKSLSETSARFLARHHDKIYLNGIEHITEGVAEALSAHKGNLLLNGVQKLSDQSALLLARHAGWLHLNGLTNFPDTPGHLALARNLAARHGGTLALNAVKELPLPILEILATHAGTLELNGLESLSAEAATILAKRGHRLGAFRCVELNGLKTLSIETARILVPTKLPPFLNGINGLPEVLWCEVSHGIQPEERRSLFMPAEKDMALRHMLQEDSQDDDPLSLSKPFAWSGEILADISEDGNLTGHANERPEHDSWVAEENEVLSQVSGVTSQEREIYRHFMGWGSESALSFAQLGKRFSMTAASARIICERVEQRMLAAKRFKLEPFHRTAPQPDERCPRDGKRLQKTGDLLFLALMLEGCSKTGWMETFHEPAGQMECRIIPKPTGSAVQGRQFWKLRTLRKLIFEHEFWEIRRLRRRPGGHRVKIPRGHVLKFPVRQGADQLLSSDSWTKHFHSWAGVTDMLINPGELLCPLCGPMPTLCVRVSSPKETWAMECGRTYDFNCCAGCLGAFDHAVSQMS